MDVVFMVVAFVAFLVLAVKSTDKLEIDPELAWYLIIAVGIMGAAMKNLGWAD